MPFKQVFERNVNRHMQEDGRASRSSQAEEGDIKKHHDAKDSEVEEEDQEISEKKDRPPRFSTLFAPTPPPPQIIERYVEPKRKSGVYLPMPLFVLLALILFFESTLLFAYTIIGLYNNAPSGLLPFGSPSSASVLGCDCASEKQAAINISPNFYMAPGQSEAKVPSIETAPLPEILLTPTTKTSVSRTSTSTSLVDATAAVPKLPGLLGGIETSPTAIVKTKIVTSTPEQKTVDKTIIATITSGVPPPITSTRWVDAPGSSANKKRASTKPTVDSAEETSTPDAKPSPTTLATAVSLKENKEKPTKTAADDAKSSDNATSDTDSHCYGGWMETQWCGKRRRAR